MFKNILIAAAIAGLALIVGCSVEGEWKTYNFKPEMARQEFDFLGSTVEGREFTGSYLILGEDQTYRAEVAYGDRIKVFTGRWKKTAEDITFINDTGQAFTYKYELEGDKLYLTDNIRGTDVVLMLKRPKK